VFATVAVGVDGSETAEKAAAYALDLAARQGSKIVFISAYKPVSEARLRREMRDVPAEHQWQVNPTEDVDGILREFEEQAAERGLQWASEASEGDPAEVLVALAAKHDADLLIVGNKGMNRRILGSVPNDVSHKAECSVMIVKTT